MHDPYAHIMDDFETRIAICVESGVQEAYAHSIALCESLSEFYRVARKLHGRESFAEPECTCWAHVRTEGS